MRKIELVGKLNFDKTTVAKLNQKNSKGPEFETLMCNPKTVTGTINQMTWTMTCTFE